ncbi:hypothetical protein NMG60_11017507 [Bertholletia excelsa]
MSFGMIGNSLASPSLTFKSATCICFSSTSIGKAPSTGSSNLQNCCPQNVIRGPWISNLPARKWERHLAAKIENVVLSDEDRKTWDTCRQALSPFNFTAEEEDKILGKAFGQIQSPYWGEERKKEVPKLEIVNEILDYLRSLSLSDDDLTKLLKKFPEILGCSLDDELRTNERILEKDWGIKGKSLRNLLLRNPKVLGYNVDCKGDCMAQCTRCWVRF